MTAVETYHQNGLWNNRVQGEQRPRESFLLKEQAVSAGRLLAILNSAEHIIKNLDGTIGMRNSYGNDPRSSRG
jgi:hypothetical protein